jgi:hypothetical protein
VDAATGHGSQTHLVYAERSHEWWLFHDPGQDTMSLATARSADFATWTTGGSRFLPSGHSGDGRDLSLAYRALGDQDVVHITQAYTPPAGAWGRYHLRATLGAGKISFDDPEIVDQGGFTVPDGTATTILPNGLVVDGTGREVTPPELPIYCASGDLIVYTSDVMDDGGTDFSHVTFSEKVLWCLNRTVCMARQLLALGDRAVYLGANGEPPSNVLADVRTSQGTWLPLEPYGQDAGAVQPPEVFVDDIQMDRNDWTAAVFADAVHAVRRINKDFEHRIMSIGPSGAVWSSGGGVPPQPTPSGSGLVLAPYGDSLVLLALSSDGHLVYTVYDPTSSTWAPWTPLCTVPAGASYLSGFAPESGAKPAVIWRQPAGADYGIAGALLP